METSVNGLATEHKWNEDTCINCLCSVLLWTCVWTCVSGWDMWRMQLLLSGCELWGSLGCHLGCSAV